MRKKIISSLALAGGGIAIVATTLVANYFLMAWTEPTQAPPAGAGSGFSFNWSDIQNRPVGLDDGDDVGAQAGTITNGKWCKGGEGDVFSCTSDAPAGGCPAGQVMVNFGIQTICTNTNVALISWDYNMGTVPPSAVHGQARVNNGVLETRVYTNGVPSNCDSGWLQSNSSSCTYTNLFSINQTIVVKADMLGIVKFYHTSAPASPMGGRKFWNE